MALAYVFADRVTHAIRGWCSVARDNIVNQEIRDNELVVPVQETPALDRHKFINFETGAMGETPEDVGLPKHGE